MPCRERTGICRLLRICDLDDRQQRNGYSVFCLSWGGAFAVLSNAVYGHAFVEVGLHDVHQFGRDEFGGG